MDHELLSRPPNLGVSPIGEWAKNLSNIIARIEFGPFQERIDKIEVTGISHYRKSHFFGLDSLSLHFRNLSVRPKPGQLVICIEIVPRLIKGYDVVPGSLLLTLPPGDKLSRESDPI
jgi:hypothetical protein